MNNGRNARKLSAEDGAAPTRDEQTLTGDYRRVVFTEGNTVQPILIHYAKRRPSMKIYAPFTDAEVSALNAYQESGDGHPLTCMCGDHIPLIATNDGWVCKNCAYTQNWAVAWMCYHVTVTFKRQGFTSIDEKDPVKRLRNLEQKRIHICENIIELIDKGQIISHEIEELKKEVI